MALVKEYNNLSRSRSVCAHLPTCTGQLWENTGEHHGVELKTKQTTVHKRLKMSKLRVNVIINCSSQMCTELNFKLKSPKVSSAPPQHHRHCSQHWCSWNPTGWTCNHGDCTDFCGSANRWHHSYHRRWLGIVSKGQAVYCGSASATSVSARLQNIVTGTQTWCTVNVTPPTLYL